MRTASIDASACGRDVPAGGTGDVAVVLELLLLGAIWGASYLFARIAAGGLPSLLMVEIRLALGAVILLPAFWRARSSFPRALWPKLAAIGLVNSALPFVLYAWAAHHAPAGVTAITSGLTVIFGALIGFLFFGERPGWKRAASWLLGLAGVAFLVGGQASDWGQGAAIAAGVAGAVCYGAGLHLAKRHLAGLPPAAAAGATLAAPALLLLPFALADLPVEPVQADAWLAATGLGILCTGLAYVLFYRLVGRIGAAGTSMVTYLIPLFGVLWGWALLGEALTPSMAAAAATIVASVGFNAWSGRHRGGSQPDGRPAESRLHAG